MSKNKTPITVILILLATFTIYYWTNSSPGLPKTILNQNVPGRRLAENPAQPAVSTEEAGFVSESSAVLNGSITPRGVATSYWFEFGETDALENRTAPQFLGSGYLLYKAPAAIIGLKPGTTYFYRAVAENQYGRQSGRTMMLFTLSNSPPRSMFLPSIETRGTLNLTENSATISGAINPRNSETRYWFEYGDTASLANTTGSGSAGEGSVNTLVSANLRGLEPGSRYYYRLIAQNDFGTVSGDIGTFETTAENSPAESTKPLVITNQVTLVGRTIATLKGEINSNGRPTTYRFDYGKATAFGLFTLDQSTEVRDAGKGTLPVDVSRNLTGLESGTTYYYQLVAENEEGTAKGAIFRFTTSTP